MYTHLHVCLHKYAQQGCVFETFTHTYRQHDGMDMHAFLFVMAATLLHRASVCASLQYFAPGADYVRADGHRCLRLLVRISCCDRY